VTIAITTPTGHVGSHVVRMLGQAGVRPRLLLRNTDLTWTEAAEALSTATGVSIKAQQVAGDEQRAALRDAGMSEVAVEGIVGMTVGKREGFTPEQPRSVLTTTPGSLAGWAITHLRPAL
jgi:nucleoside-diphosphate-sugar epimerase